MDSKQKQAVVAKLLGNNSCRGCQYLYFQDKGYSNYTVTETMAHCALNKNPKIPEQGTEIDVWAWSHDEVAGIKDKFHATCNSMCERYCPKEGTWHYAQFDVDRERTMDEATSTLDAEPRAAVILHHTGR